MHLSVIAEMAGGAMADRVLVGGRDSGLTGADLLARAQRAGAFFAARGAGRVALVDQNSEAVPLTLFGAAFAGRPYVPLNYRLADDRLRGLLERTAPATVVADASVPGRVGRIDGIEFVDRRDFLAAASDEGAPAASAAPVSADDIGVLLFTSGTTGDPKAAVLRHQHLTSYVLSSVEFMGAGEDEASIVSVPPYHIAGTSAVLTGIYGGRRIVYLEQFDPRLWVDTARAESVTHAMVVPTMLGRILDTIEGDGEGLPSLSHVSYGGGRMPGPVIEKALEMLPDVSWVNAYGLTETSSTIALLGPEDHRQAFTSDDPLVRGRLGSVGRPLPSVEVEIRDEDGDGAPVGETGLIWVRGEQVSGEYIDRDARHDGWFPTNDTGRLDADGYLYVDGRADDVIVRGGENMSPGEIEDVLVAHGDVSDAAVVGIPDAEWGERVAAVVVLLPGATTTTTDLRDWVRDRLRSSRTPEVVEVRSELPYNETGKLLRRELRSELAATHPSD